MRIAASITTNLFAVLMVISGALYLIGPKPIVDGMRELGYPLYFVKMLGAAKLLGAAALVTPRRSTLREWAYAGFTFDLLAAVISHVASGGASHVPLPLFVLALLLTSYVLRRRLSAEVAA